MIDEDKFIIDFKIAFPEFKDQNIKQSPFYTLKELAKIIATDSAKFSRISEYEKKSLTCTCFSLLISFAKVFFYSIYIICTIMNIVCSLRAGGCGYSTTLRRRRKKLPKTILMILHFQR